MKTCLFVVGNKIFDKEVGYRGKGGMQTYANHLLNALSKHGWECTVVQLDRKNEDFIINGISVKTISIPGYGTKLGYYSGITAFLYSIHISRVFRNQYNLIVYLDQNGAWPCILHPSIYIQHGVYNDIPCPNNLISKIKQALMNILIHDREYDISKNSDATICVDTNFKNIVRKRFPWRPTKNLYYIPNHSHKFDEEQIINKVNNISNENHITFCFARRLETFRGIKEVLIMWTMLEKKYKNIDLIIAGSGTFDIEVTNYCAKHSNAKKVLANREDMDKILLHSHIVLIPSTGSEGTSYSCIEGMAAGCVPITSDVGGLGNLIIPGFNGIIADPDPYSLFQAAERLIQNPLIVSKMAMNSFLIANQALDYDSWEKNIIAVVNLVSSKRGKIDS